MSAEDEKEAIRLGLPPKFLSYKQLPECSCNQCKEDDEYLKDLFDNKTKISSVGSSISQNLFGTPISTISSQRSNESVFGTPNSQTSFSFTPSSTTQTPLSLSNETLRDLLRKPKITSPNNTNLFSSPVFDTKPSTPNFTFSLNSTPTTTTSIFGNNNKSGSVFGGSLFSTTPTTAATTNIFGNSKNMFTSSGSLFSNTITPTFGNNTNNVFGSGGFISASNLLNKSEQITSSETEKLKDTDEVILKCDTGLSFASLAAKTQEPPVFAAKTSNGMFL